MILNEDRLFPAEPTTRSIARRLYLSIRGLPILSPHGHTNPRWFAENEPFPDPTQLFVVPDHYVLRMLYSQGIPLEQLAIESTSLEDSKRVWRIFAQHYYLFRGTPTRLWLDFAFQQLFGLDARLTPANADEYYDSISEKLKTPAFRPRSLFERFQLELLATTDSPLDSLAHHEAIRASGFRGRIIPTFRPDPVVDPDFPGFKENLARLAQITGVDTSNWDGYVSALRQRRLQFKALGCTATDHGHPTAATADLASDSAARLFHKVASGSGDADEHELFRAQMLTEMAAMSLDDGLVMQIHPGSLRNHNTRLFQRFGPDVGADIPTPTDYVHALRPLLDRFGNEPRLTIILFTLDESTYSRELAPLAGHYPCLRLGPAWWFHDSPEGMTRFREYTTETAGFYNTVGFNDDARAFLSLPARHDVARRIDCSFLARLVAEHRIDEDEAYEIAADLAYGLARKAYRL
ncbi:MAG TPA: glucuronate isomerase [Terriglobales bacterium]|jgi:glucuronate isomerase|nr:glucuronate isomerase [Terriglobales bacterium]